jgi:hypothetical protein
MLKQVITSNSQVIFCYPGEPAPKANPTPMSDQNILIIKDTKWTFWLINQNRSKIDRLQFLDQLLSWLVFSAG